MSHWDKKPNSATLSYESSEIELSPKGYFVTLRGYQGPLRIVPEEIRAYRRLNVVEDGLTEGCVVYSTSTWWLVRDTLEALDEILERFHYHIQKNEE